MSTDSKTQVNGDYSETNLKTLKDAAHIRQNPGMYVGNTQSAGLHHLVYEIVYNSVDEALAGYCKNIRVVIHSDSSITVADDGRGIPVGVKKDTASRRRIPRGRQQRRSTTPRIARVGRAPRWSARP